MITRKRLQPEDVKTLLDTLDASFASRLQERTDLMEYSRKLSTYATFELMELENNIVGAIAFYTNTETANLYVPYVCVHKAYRHRGIAEAMMADLCLYADSCRVDISLEVRKDNLGARRLYEKAGFQIIKDNGSKLYLTRKWTSRASY